VVGITDSDTIKVMHNGKAEKIRLNGIDCPEMAQPFGTKAKHPVNLRVNNPKNDDSLCTEPLSS
jgi:endonuclease YncB( thermonuclease family)